MDTTTRLGLPYPELVELADGPDAFQLLAEAIDNAAIVGQGTLANRPVSSGGSPGIVGRIYRATDTGLVYWDTGTSWVAIGPSVIAPDSITAVEVAANAIGASELADNAVDAAAIADNAVVNRTVADGAIGFAEVAAALKPSQGAAGGDEALRALGTAAGRAAAGTHAAQHLPAGADPLEISLDIVADISLPTPANGRIVFLKPAGVDEALSMVYNSTIGKWVSQVFTGPPGTAVNVATTGLTNWLNFLSGGASGTSVAVPNFKALYDAGLRLQVQAIAYRPVLAGNPYNRMHVGVGVYGFTHADPALTFLVRTGMLIDLVALGVSVGDVRSADWTQIPNIGAFTKEDAILIGEYSTNNAANSGVTLYQFNYRWVSA